jgi:hypothetical protein
MKRFNVRGTHQSQREGERLNTTTGWPVNGDLSNFSPTYQMAFLKIHREPNSVSSEKVLSNKCGKKWNEKVIASHSLTGRREVKRFDRKRARWLRGVVRLDNTKEVLVGPLPLVRPFSTIRCNYAHIERFAASSSSKR